MLMDQPKSADSNPLRLKLFSLACWVTLVHRSFERHWIEVRTLAITLRTHLDFAVLTYVCKLTLDYVEARRQEGVVINDAVRKLQ